jgi:hypothetical protein
MVLEGTGHAAMGSLMRLTNARVAAELGVECVLVAGGRTRLSNIIDDIALNRQMCAQHRLPIRGVIINGVPQDKIDDALEYIPRALKFWGLPLLGVVPHIPTLSRPCMADFERLFGRPMVSAESSRLQAFQHIALVGSSVEDFKQRYYEQQSRSEEIVSGNSDDSGGQLIVAHQSRADLIDAMVQIAMEWRSAHPGGEQIPHGVILTGSHHEPGSGIIAKLQEAGIPALHAPLPSYEAMDAITKFIPQLYWAQAAGEEGGVESAQARAVTDAVSAVESAIDIDTLMRPIFARPEADLRQKLRF